MNPKIGNVAQLCAAYRFVVSSGRGKGEEMLFLANGALTVLLNLSRAGDVHQAWVYGKNVSFVSKNGLAPHEPSFLKRFPGGLLYTCGFDALGEQEAHELHGSFHLQPAEVVRLECNEEGILVELRVEDASLFGTRLTMLRRYEMKVDEPRLVLRDELKNDGFERAPYALLYHCNFGYPFLDEGSEIELNAKESLPRTVWAAKQFEKRLEIEGPEPEAEETCYFHSFESHAVALNSKRLALRLVLSSSLPFLVEWKCRRSGDYVLGLEPSTSYLDDRFAPLELGPGESQCFTLEWDFQSEKGETLC